MKYLTLVVSVVIANLAGILGSIFTVNSINSWYLFLNKPFFSPPNWLFGPVWVVLYTLMGIAAWLVWEKTKSESNKKALIIYGIQLFLNFLWTLIFFGLKNPALAFLEILVLLAFIIYTTVLFFKIDKRAGWIMVPYILWISFASMLNLAIWALN